MSKITKFLILGNYLIEFDENSVNGKIYYSLGQVLTNQDVVTEFYYDYKSDNVVFPNFIDSSIIRSVNQVIHEIILKNQSWMVPVKLIKHNNQVAIYSTKDGKSGLYPVYRSDIKTCKISHQKYFEHHGVKYYLNEF